MKIKLWFKTTLLFGVLLFNSTIADACRCLFPSLTSSYYASSHVALVKILGVENIIDDSTKRYKNKVEVEILEQIKGSKKTVYTTDAFTFTSPELGFVSWSSCAFDIKVGTTWLVFASENQKGPYFHYCSNSSEIQEIIVKNLKTLKKLKAFPSALSTNNNIVLNSQSYLTFPNNLSEKKDGYAVFEIKLDKNLEINSINSLINFDDPSIADWIQKESILSNLKFRHLRNPVSEKKFTKNIVISVSTDQENQLHLRIETL